MMRQMDEVLQQLRRTGAHVVLTTQAPTAPAQFHQIRRPTAGARTTSFGRLNQLLLQFAAQHPNDVTLVDLAGKVCPGGPPCPAKVDGITLRPFDGAHFSPQGAVWASEWLLRTSSRPAGKPPAGRHVACAREQAAAPRRPLARVPGVLRPARPTSRRRRAR